MNILTLLHTTDKRYFNNIAFNIVSFLMYYTIFYNMVSIFQIIFRLGGFYLYSKK